MFNKLKQKFFLCVRVNRSISEVDKIKSYTTTNPRTKPLHNNHFEE